MTAQVTSVVADPSGEAVWTFDTPIVEVNAIGGLNVGGAGSPQAWTFDPPYVIFVQYEDAAVAGEGWSVDPGLCEIVFSNGAVLAAGSGTVE